MGQTPLPDVNLKFQHLPFLKYFECVHTMLVVIPPTLGTQVISIQT